MDGQYLYCNLRNCNKCLDEGHAWVTTCSHIFCMEDGEKLFQESLMCPCCQKELDPKSDLIRIKLNPSEQFRNMVLFGQRPQVIMEVCENALKFWYNQLRHENQYMKHLVESEREKRLIIEKNEADLQFKIKQIQKKCDELRKENENLKKQLDLQKTSSFIYQQNKAIENQNKVNTLSLFQLDVESYQTKTTNTNLQSNTLFN